MQTLTASFVVVMSAASVSIGGELDASLEAVINHSSGKDRVPALVYMTLQADVDGLESQLLEDRTPRRDRHTVIMTALQAAGDLGQASVLDWLNAQSGGEVANVQSFWITSVIALEATPGTLRALAAREDVAIVAPDYPIELVAPTSIDDDTASSNRGGPEQGLIAIGVPDVWAMGYDGTGTIVSNIDTGVDGSHPALASRWRGLNPLYSGHPEWAFYDPYLGNHNFPYDGGSHGTHTMGTVTGGAPGDQIGVAPGAEWIAAAPIDRGGGIPQTVSDAILSFQWIADPDGNPLTSFDVPHTCSNSWGLVTGHGYPECDQTFWSFIDNAEAAGVIVLFSAGNEGSSGLRRPGDRAYDDYRTMAVAAVDPYNGNSIASFSSRGPTNCTPTGGSAIKPDIAAPGVSTRSSVPGGGYSSYDGTSMASPHVNGVLALMLQANPDLTGEQAKQIVYDTAVEAGSPGKDNDYGYGIIDAVAAVESALETVSLTVSYPDGRPELIDPNGGTELVVRFGGNVAPEPGTALLNWWVGPISGEEPMLAVGENHVGVFPAFGCGDEVLYWVSVESVEGDYVTSPYNAPIDSWSAEAWSGVEVAFDDDFNSNQGWTVYAGAGTGNWERVTPSGSGGTRCDNATDQDGSGMCYVSGNGTDEDIDDGTTTLTSPAMDASDGGTLRYARWYSNGASCGGADPNNDIFVVDISDDDGSSWVELEVVGPGGSEADGGWFVKEWTIEDLPVSMTDTFRIRFTASDLNEGSVVEAAVDAVSITRMYCDDTTMPGDADGDGDVDTDDILSLIAQWGPCPPGDCSADFDGDGDVDTDDILILLANFGA
ncbi:MAG: S8 family serine peptidase [Phycisphaerales bacterium]|nr:S8 family serine peptidase [Phycisphaerales bacterium]